MGSNIDESLIRGLLRGVSFGAEGVVTGGVGASGVACGVAEGGRGRGIAGAVAVAQVAIVAFNIGTGVLRVDDDISESAASLEALRLRAKALIELLRMLSPPFLL